MADWQGNAEPEDLADDSQYCKHGNYVGNWATGDYLCGWCEDGTPDDEYRAYIEYETRRRHIRIAATYWIEGLPRVDQACCESLIVGIMVTMAKLRHG